MATIPFLPDRLNREPTVFKGLTTTELFIAFAGGFISGLLISIPFAFILASWALIPTAALICSALAILLGGKHFAKLKRGRPDTWLYLFIQVKLAQLGLGNHHFIVSKQDHVWSIRRSI